LRLDDEEAASIRAASSDGVHFSFEKVDSVTRSTICGRFEPSAVMEQVLYRSQLVSFALTEHALTAVRYEVSELGQEGSAAEEELAAAAEREEVASCSSACSADNRRDTGCCQRSASAASISSRCSRQPRRASVQENSEISQESTAIMVQLPAIKGTGVFRCSHNAHSLVTGWYSGVTERN
jgi:hypothetical protein